jgi:hypothetical protein
MFTSQFKKLLLLLFAVASLSLAHAQDEFPDEIFRRTLLIRSGSELSTAFRFDQGGRIYLVTTRHLVKNLPLKNAVVQVWHGSWTDLQTVRTLFPGSKDIDLAVLETDQRIETPYKVVRSSEVLTTGQKVWYMGWVAPTPRPQMPASMPHTSRPISPEIPAVSIGTITAIDPTRPDPFEIPVKGGYNLGIAPGPIVYWSPVHKDFEIIGVIAADESHAESSSVLPWQKIVKTNVMRAYSIDVVADTIGVE